MGIEVGISTTIDLLEVNLLLFFRFNLITRIFKKRFVWMLVLKQIEATNEQQLTVLTTTSAFTRQQFSDPLFYTTGAGHKNLN